MTSSSTDRQAYTPEQWKNIFKEWEQSGLSKVEFCNLKNITPSVFYKWLHKLKYPESFQHESNFQNQEDISSEIGLSSSQNKKKPRPRRFYTPEQWKDIFKEWEQSGLGRDSFCLQRNLTPSVFTRWRKKLMLSGDSKKLKASSATPPPKTSIQDRFIPVTLSPSSFSNTSSPKMEIVFANGHRLYLQGPFDWHALSTWLNPLLVR